MGKRNEVVKVSEQELFNHLVDECKSIITERVFRSRLEIIIAHGEIGQRVVNDSLYKKYGKNNKEFIEQLASGIGISYAEICRSIQFWVKYRIDSPNSESWKNFKEGKNISWSGIKQNYLPAPGFQKNAINAKYKIGQQIKADFSGAIIAVKGGEDCIVYKVEFEARGKKDDLWIPEDLIKGVQCGEG